MAIPTRPRWWTLGGFDHEPASSERGPFGLFARMLGGGQEANP